VRCTLPSYQRARGTDKKETGTEEVSATVMKEHRNISQPTRTIGLDLEDRNSWYGSSQQATERSSFVPEVDATLSLLSEKGLSHLENAETDGRTAEVWFEEAK